MSTPTYYDRVNEPLLRALPAGLGSVLDIGCGAGALGAAYKRVNPATRWAGIEYVADAAAVARGRLDAVVEGDAQTLAAGESLPGAPFDAIVYADSIEHFAHPKPVVAGHLTRLKPGGWVYASVPNVQHWSALFNLMAGKWDYASEGLFDDTHLRFFTFDSLTRFFRALGAVEVVTTPVMLHADVRPAAAGPDRKAIVLDSVKRAAEALALPYDERKFLAYQYIVRARFPG